MPVCHALLFIWDAQTFVTEEKLESQPGVQILDNAKSPVFYDLQSASEIANLQLKTFQKLKEIRLCLAEDLSSKLCISYVPLMFFSIALSQLKIFWEMFSLVQMHHWK